MDIEGLDLKHIPIHVGCVMDGNGRWAKSKNLARTQGHAAGEGALFDVIEAALEVGVKWLTVFAFSTENWRRPAEEVKYLLHFNEGILDRRRDELNKKGVRIRFAGRRNWRVPNRTIARMVQAEELTAGNDKLTLTVAFNYGGRAEIVDAVRQIVSKGIPANKIDEKTIAEHLYYPDTPDPDLVIRTSGEYRISNFLLWQLAYSELIFSDVLWPDFNRENFFAAIDEYQRRDRRYGGIKR